MPKTSLLSKIDDFGTDAVDKVVAYYQDPDKYPLSPREADALQRWELLYSFKKRFLFDKTAINLAFKELEKLGKSVSIRQLYTDLKNAQKFYGRVFTQDFEFKTSIYIEALEEIAQLARHSNDFKSAIAAMKEAFAMQLKLQAVTGALESGKPSEPNTYNMNITIIKGGKSKHKQFDIGKLANIPEAEIIDIVNGIDPAVPTEAELRKMLRQSNGDKADHSE